MYPDFDGLSTSEVKTIILEKKVEHLNMLSAFVDPIAELDGIIGQQSDETFNLIANHVQKLISENPYSPVFDKLQFNALKVMKEGMVGNLKIEVESADNLDRDLQKLYSQYFWEKFSDDEAYMDKNRKYFPNKEILILFNNECEDVLKGVKTLKEAVIKIMNFNKEFEPNPENEILNIFSDVISDRKHLTKYFLCVNLIATINAANMLEKHYDLAVQGGIKDLWDLGYKGHIDRQISNKKMLEEPNMSMEEAWEMGKKSILTDSTFGSYLTLVFAHSKNNREVLTKYSNKITRAISEGASPLIRAYNNAGAMYDNPSYTKKKLNEIYSEYTKIHGEHGDFFDLLRFVNTYNPKSDETQNKFSNMIKNLDVLNLLNNNERKFRDYRNLLWRLQKDYVELEWNPILNNIDLNLSLKDQIQQVVNLIKEDHVNVNVAKLELLNAYAPDNLFAFRLLSGFTLLNYLNYKISNRDYDKEFKPSKVSKLRLALLEMPKFFRPVVPNFFKQVIEG